MASTSPTARTLAALRDDGWLVAVVEYWGAFDHKRHDLFNVFDVLAVRPGETLAVQTTTMDNNAARLKKLMASKEVQVCLSAGWRVEVWSWFRYKTPVDRKWWRATVTPIRHA